MLCFVQRFPIFWHMCLGTSIHTYTLHMRRESLLISSNTNPPVDVFSEASNRSWPRNTAEAISFAHRERPAHGAGSLQVPWTPRTREERPLGWVYFTDGWDGRLHYRKHDIENMSTRMIGLPCTRRRIQNACRMPAHVTLQNTLNIEQVRTKLTEQTLKFRFLLDAPSSMLV